MAVSEEKIRRVAIDHHHIQANRFERNYADLDSNRFSSAFTYGRAKVDYLVEELFRIIPSGGAILDVGCGTGEHLKLAMKQGLRAFGVEPAPAMLEVARRNVPECEVEEGVATKLPYEDGKFDAVIMIEVLRYLHRHDVEEALAEARRVLKTGGTLFVTLVNRWALDGFYLLQRGRQLFSRSAYDKSHPYCLFFTPKAAERLLREAGFENVRTEGRLFAPVRIVYKLGKSMGMKFASSVERLDDRVHQWRWTRPFAGHLIAIANKPGGARNKPNSSA